VTAEQGTISAATKALGLTQPTLTRQVSVFESDLKRREADIAIRSFHLTPNDLITKNR
jgi:DNA-binding transcriptional LysR family regulator